MASDENVIGLFSSNQISELVINEISLLKTNDVDLTEEQEKEYRIITAEIIVLAFNIRFKPCVNLCFL